MDTQLPSKKRVAALRHLHDKLKSGDYDGTDVMAAWIAIEDLACLLERAENEPRVAQFSKRRPMLEESDAWASAEDERDWWRNYALQIERAATPPRVGINGAGSILGCTCEMCEFHRSAEAIERQRRATSTKCEGQS